jgi:hypothetical protein
MSLSLRGCGKKSRTQDQGSQEFTSRTIPIGEPTLKITGVIKLIEFRERLEQLILSEAQRLSL